MAFAFCAIVSSFGSGNSIQAFTVADQIRTDIGVPTWITGLVSASLVAAVILGGIRRIGAVTSRLVPYMAAIYVAGGLLVLLFNLTRLPELVWSIFSAAFQPAAAVSGFAGGTFVFMLTWGVKRGLFSNEAGQGSAPIAHAAARTDEPVREGVVALMEPMIDTLIVCTITGLVILASGAWHEKKDDQVPLNTQSDITVIEAGAEVRIDGKVADRDRFDGTAQVVFGEADVAFVRNHASVSGAIVLQDGEPWNGELIVEDGDIDFAAIPALELSGGMLQNGSPLTAWAFQKELSPVLGRWGFLIVTVGVVLFGISTAISWSYYGDRAVVYLWGPRYVTLYKIVFCIMNFLGAVFSLEVVWNFGDSALGLMALPNLLGLILLNGKIRRLTNAYFAKKQVPLR
jgi:AGCS family alanine or glycine:cation symporter